MVVVVVVVKVANRIACGGSGRIGRTRARWFSARWRRRRSIACLNVLDLLRQQRLACHLAGREFAHHLAHASAHLGRDLDLRYGGAQGRRRRTGARHVGTQQLQRGPESIGFVRVDKDLEQSRATIVLVLRVGVQRLLLGIDAAHRRRSQHRAEHRNVARSRER